MKKSSLFGKKKIKIVDIRKFYEKMGGNYEKKTVDIWGKVL
jgi:hypothetical protein